MVYLVTGQKSLFNSLGDTIQFAELQDVKNWLQSRKEIALDTETTGFDPYTCKLLSLQLGDLEDQFVIDCKTIDIRGLKQELEARDKLWLLQNAKFDLKFLFHKRIVIGNVYDTMLAERVLTTGLVAARKSLDYLTSKYLKINLDKTVRGVIHKEGLSIRVIKYAADDVKYLHQIKEKQEAKIAEQDLKKALELDNLYVRVLAYIEYSGIKLDINKWKAKIEEDERAFQEAKKKLDDYIIENDYTNYIEKQLDLFDETIKCKINWASSKQVIKFFKDLGINTVIQDEKGENKDSVESKVIASQGKQFPIIPIYLDYKGAEKVCSTYGESFLRQINPVSGRIHTSFTQIMDTGRLSCGGKDRSTGEEYVNLQNIPKDEETRSCFIACDGYTFIVSDYSGQEQIVLVNQSLDKGLLEFYDKGYDDMHSFIASKIYFKEIGELSFKEIKRAHPDKRNRAKSAGFAINYGGNGLTISENLGISREEGDFVYNSYFQAFPELSDYFNKSKRRALQTGYVYFNHITRRKSYIDFFEDYKKLGDTVNAEGFWLDYREHKSKDTDKFRNYFKPLVKKYFQMRGTIERKSLNYPVQGTSADITKLAGIYLFRYLEEKDLLFKVWLPNVIHDEIMVEPPKELAQELSVVVKDCMERAGAVFYTRVRLKAEPCITEVWKH